MATATAKIVETCKRSAARLAVDENITGSCVLGVGSGTTIKYALERVKELCAQRNFVVHCIPTSYQAMQLICDQQLPLSDLSFHSKIDITIDGADEVDKNLVAIKGGGGCLTQEKVVAVAADKFFVVADYRKESEFLGQTWMKGVPIEVLPMAANFVRHRMSSMLEDTDTNHILLRQSTEKAGPVVTDNGNFILDWKFDYEKFKSKDASDWRSLAFTIKSIPGVVETGIFASSINAAYFGHVDGSVIKRNIL